MDLTSNTQTKILTRSYLEVKRDPEEILGAVLGEGFKTYRRRFREAEAGERLDRPLHLDVDVTTNCQLRCPMCPVGHKEQKKFKGFGLFMKESLYLEALRQASEFKLPSIRFGLTGEPLLVADIENWAAEAKKAGVIDISLITNGQLLDGDKSRKLIKSGLTRIMLSVDAATSETYAKVRPGGDFSLLQENLQALVAKRKELNSHLPLIRLSFVVMDVNAKERRLFREKFSPLADYLSFQRYQDLTAAGIKGVEIASDDDRVNSQGIDSQGLNSLGINCPDPLTRLAIHADGGLFPCCSDFGRLSPLGYFPQDSLLDVWNSPQALELATSQGRTNPRCLECLRA
ncbi:MAG: radical SAM protein [Deltaproteobacteria bacterium]|jgi:hypothetical protein|nr:radical SAM protein [Deltaproteobacteria bacterium]